MAVNTELSGIQSFDSTGDSTSVSPRWKRWRKSLQFFVEAKGIEEAKQKKALLLHCDGVDVQEIFEALDNSEAGVSSKVSKTDDEIALKILIRRIFLTEIERSLRKARFSSNEARRR
jgi:hypothetical protein